MEDSLLIRTGTPILTLIFLFALVNSAGAIVDLEALSIENDYEPSDGVFHRGEEIIAHWWVTNGGDEESDDYTIEVYVGEYYMGSDSMNGLRSHKKRHGYLRRSLPGDIPYGDHPLRMKVVCANDDTPNNNESIGPSITVDEKGPPDLSFSDFAAYDGIFYGEDTVTLYCRIENTGHSDSDDYSLDFYIDGTKFGSETHSGIEGHGSETFDSKITLPYDFPAGGYDIDVELSCLNDSNSGNNSDSASITVYKSWPPDVSLVAVDVTDGIYRPGDSAKVTTEVQCGDGQLFGELSVDFYASTDDTISFADYFINSEDYSNLNPEESYTFETVCQFPSHLPDGDYYIGAIATYPDEGIVVCDGQSVWVGAPVDVAVQAVNATGGTYWPNDSIKVYSLVKNIGDRASESYTVDYYLSTDTTITPADYRIGCVERAGLAPGKQHSYETTCQFPISIPAGAGFIGIVISCPKDYDRANNASCDSASVYLAHPPGYVCGQATYRRHARSDHPIRYARVCIYADDSNGNPVDDRLLGESYTNLNGDFALTLPNDGNWDSEIYAKILTEGASGAYPETASNICILKDDVLDETYSLLSTTHPHPKDASVLINMTAPGDGEFMVYDSIIEGFSKAMTCFDIELAEVMVHWPSEDGGSYFDPQDLGIYIAQDDRRDRDVIMHEYAHYIAELYGVCQGPVGDSSLHSWDGDLRHVPIWRTDEHAMNLAFREAWATLFSIATQYGDTGYPHSGDSTYNDLNDNGSFAIKADLDNIGNGDFFPGQYHGNMNAGALWDIFTDINSEGDDSNTLSDSSLSMIWSISRDYKPDNIADFWNRWFQDYDYEQAMKDIFEAHDMPFVIPGK